MRTFAMAALAASATAFDAESVPQFIAGFMYGMTGYNHLTEIEACYTGGQQIVIDSQKAWKDATSGDYFKGIVDAGKAWNEIGSAMTTCQGMDDDIAAIQAWAQIFTQPTLLSKTVAKNWLLHGNIIKVDIANEELDWDQQEYFNAGVDTANALTEAVGPITTNEVVIEGEEIADYYIESEEIANYALGLDLLAIPELAAGFFYGMVGDNHLTEMQSCYSSTTELGGYLEAALKDIEAFHIFGALKQFEEFVYHFQLDVAPCTQMQDDVSAIELWAQAFKNPKSLVSSATKHYLLHKKAITQDIATLKADYAAKSFFATGRTAADILTILVGEIQ